MAEKFFIAYWLIPAEPAHSFFQQVINDLAQRYDAPSFEPHLTIHVGANDADAAEAAVAEASRKWQSIAAEFVGIDHSDEFIKTLFVQFAPNRKLQKLNTIIRDAAGDSSEYRFNPHLSLLYKKMATSSRAELTTSISLPFSEVTFDAVQAVRCISPTETRADVEAWRVIASASFRAHPAGAGGVEECRGMA